MITAGRFRSIRKRLMKELAPEFTENDTCYTRETEHRHLHCIEFGHPLRRRGFVVDLGIHFVGVPHLPLLAPSPRRPERYPGQLRDDKCWLQRRWRKPDGDQFFDYGETPEQAEILIRSIVDGCLAALNEIDAGWQKGERLLELVPPQRLRQDAEIFATMFQASTVEQGHQISDKVFIRQLFPAWFPQVQETALLFAFLSLHFKRPELVAPYVEVVNYQARGFWIPQWMADLSQEALRLASVGNPVS